MFVKRVGGCLRESPFQFRVDFTPEEYAILMELLKNNLRIPFVLSSLTRPPIETELRTSPLFMQYKQFMDSFRNSLATAETVGGHSELARPVQPVSSSGTLLQDDRPTRT